MEIILTDDQDEAVKFITAFVNKPAVNLVDDLFAVLSGFAGTGKTTVMNTIIKKIKHKDIVVSAPTHTAKEVIAGMTKQSAETIQALLGLRPNVDLAEFNPNKPQFAVIAKEKISNYQVLIIDESSMINKYMFQLIVDKAIQFKVKVIFMGDVFQLPPINESMSDAFKLKNKVDLTTIIRQSNTNPNQKLIELARNDVRDNSVTFAPYLNQIKADINGDEGFMLLKKEDFYPKIMEYYYDSEYKHNINLIKTLCWTNEAVTAINNYVRHNLIKSNEQIAVGDVMTGYKTVTEELKIHPFYINYVKNSVDYLVESVEIVSKDVTGVLLKGYQVKLSGEENEIFILHRDSYLDFAQEYKYRESMGKVNRSWKPFYNFKNKVIIMETILLDGVKVCDKDIGYGYAITVHKSQGSTYDNVAVVLTDINKNRNKTEARKLTYVAVSRTSKMNICLAHS